MRFRHRVRARGAGRSESHRLQMFRNMVTSLIQHERIKTTLPKARELVRLSDRLVTFAKKGGLANYIQAGRYVMTEPNLKKLFTILAARFRGRAGGYTRVLKTYPRLGDSAEMAFVEFVDRPASMMRMPWPLPEQPTSTMPGRGGRAYRLGIGKRDLRDEIK